MSQPILTITTLKNWVLPPRPKNARKCKSPKRAKASAPVKAALAKAPAAPHPATHTPEPPHASKPAQHQPVPQRARDVSHCTELHCAQSLEASIAAVDRENYHLKTKLLLLIHDYKSLKTLVTAPASSRALAPNLYDHTTARKRVFHELAADPMSELISDMSELTHTSPAVTDTPEEEVFNYVNLEATDLDDSGDDLLADDDDLDLACLLRLSSPSTSETDEGALLMTTLTRSTTVSTTNSTSVLERKPPVPVRLYDLPSFSEDNYAFMFENINPHGKVMSVIEEDHYNQVADFLEEKLLSNDVQYYVDKGHN